MFTDKSECDGIPTTRTIDFSRRNGMVPGMATCRKTRQGIDVTLSAHEVDLIRFLGGELRRLLEHGDPEQGILKPFHPQQQRRDDPEAAATELDASMDAELMLHRLRRIEEVQEELLRDATEDEGLRVSLTEARADIWLAYLADLRLLLSAVIGITPEEPDPIGDDEDEWTMEMRMYVFLSALQEWLIQALNG